LAPAGPLIERIREELRAVDSISFARFMELALYDPQGGYYSRPVQAIGRKGEFVTASDVGRAFGESIARQLIEVDSILGSPSPFVTIEFGAGRGLLARDVIDAAQTLEPEFAGRLCYRMVERTEAMRARARETAPEAECLAPEEAFDPAAGCVLAVELFDALPVRRVRRSGGQLFEVRVELDDSGELVESNHPASEALKALAEERGAAASDGTEAEIAEGAEALLETLCGALTRGALFVVDYGDRAPALYARPRGTLLAYHGHATNESYLARVGEQDLTAHVDFSLLERKASSLGLDRLVLTTQDRFLISNGILEAFDPGEDAGRPGARTVKRRLQAMQLIHPEGMGRIFKVLALSKGIEPPPELAGLRDPFG
jgi:SAM-dependent MidA family methyltransferase